MADFDYVALAKNLLAELFTAAKGENSGPAKPPVESTSGANKILVFNGSGSYTA
jgi:hypothetical protein